MTPARLETLLDAYGADAAHWPDAERADALALLARSPEAQRMLAEARRLDALLATANVPAPADGLGDAIVGAMPGVRRSRVVRIALRAAAPLAAAAAIALWVGRGTFEAPPADLSADAVAALGVWDVPTDGLLADTGLTAVETTPAFGCDDPLGCPALDTGAGATSQSRRALERMPA